MSELSDLLAEVEEADEFSGALVVDYAGDGEPPRTVVAIAQRGRLCWVATPGRSHRLREILRESALRSISRADLGAAVAECRRSGEPLVDHLIARGLLSEGGLRRAILRHAVESLLERVGEAARTTTWSPRAGGYHPRASVAPAEVAEALGAELFPREAADAHRGELDGVETASFAVEDAEPTTVRWSTAAESRDPEPRVRRSARLGRWATAALEASAGFSGAAVARVAAEIDPTAGIALGWRSSPRIVHATVVAGSELVDAAGRLRQRGFPVVVSSRGPHRT